MQRPLRNSKLWLAGLLTLVTTGAFADCNLDAELFLAAEATGGSVQCTDRDYYRALGAGQAPVVPMGFTGNCVASGAKVLCKSGTLVQYASPTKLTPATQAEPEVLAPRTLMTFTAVREPAWLDRPAEPGEWDGLNCLVRVWEKLPNGAAGKLLMYRHGARTDLQVALNGQNVIFGAYADSSGSHPQNFDYYISLSAGIPGKYSHLQMDARKKGRCLHDKGSSCVRAEGEIRDDYKDKSPDSLNIQTPVAVVIEDSCAKTSHSYLLDARPFWYKLPIPRH